MHPGSQVFWENQSPLFASVNEPWWERECPSTRGTGSTQMPQSLDFCRSCKSRRGGSPGSSRGTRTVTCFLPGKCPRPGIQLPTSAVGAEHPCYKPSIQPDTVLLACEHPSSQEPPGLTSALQWPHPSCPSPGVSRGGQPPAQPAPALPV